MTEDASVDSDLPSLDSNTTSPVPSRQSMTPVESKSYNPSIARWTRKYAPEASIALVGIRGTGLSTLAVFAANLLNFRLLDADHQFYQTTGLSRAKFRSNHGITKYRDAETNLLRSMLLSYPSRTVIVCGPGAVEVTGQALLVNYALDHPVIYVSRDLQGIQEHLRVWDTDTISSIHRATTPTLRSVSNFEFYNSTHLIHADSHHNQRQDPSSSLALKHVEQNFSHFLRSVMKQHETVPQRQNHLQLLALSGRQFTSALTLHAPVPDSFWSNARHEDFLADAIELIVPNSMRGSALGAFHNSDADYVTQQYYNAKSAVQVPVILNLMSINHPSTPTDEIRYFDALHHGLRLSPEFLCVDLNCDRDRIRRLVAVKGGTKIIADYTESTPSPESWGSSKWKKMIYMAEELGADVVRLRKETTDATDNFAVRCLVDQITASNEAGIPIVAYNTGALGKMSRYCGIHLNPVADSRLHDPATSEGRNPLLTAQEAQRALYSSYILDTMVFGIYGNNVSHSLSPAMHNAAFEASGIPHTYKMFQHSTLEGLKRLLSDPRLGGLSITAPFKTEVIPFVNQISHEAQVIGAVNTLIPLRSKKAFLCLERNRAGPPVALYGDNTDWIGIRDCVQENLSPINAINQKTTALVVGAGGMARAATYALIGLGVRRLFFHNRTRERAEALVDHFGGETRLCATDVTCPSRLGELAANTHTCTQMRILEEKSNFWPHDADHPTIIISCIATRDIHGECSVDTSLPPAWLASPTGGVVLELSYAPLNTPLLKQVRDLTKQGWIAIDGLQMLPAQGKTQFELFTSRRAPTKLMRKAVLSAYAERMRI